MKTLIIYDTMYGNTEEIAKSIGKAITGDVKVVHISDVNPLDLESIDLLIVGSPTQGFRPTKPIQAFIDNIKKHGLKGKGTDVAAFDTRISSDDVGTGLKLLMSVGGYAAKPIAKALEKKGGKLLISPEGFIVKEKEGPLKQGELERAFNWAKQLLRVKLI